MSAGRRELQDIRDAVGYREDVGIGDDQSVDVLIDYKNALEERLSGLLDEREKIAELELVRYDKGANEARLTEIERAIEAGTEVSLGTLRHGQRFEVCGNDDATKGRIYVEADADHYVTIEIEGEDELGTWPADVLVVPIAEEPA